MIDFAEFDEYADAREANGDTTPIPVMFGEWLASISGNTIIGGPVDEAPEFIALGEDGD